MNEIEAIDAMFDVVRVGIPTSVGVSNIAWQDLRFDPPDAPWVRVSTQHDAKT